MQSLDPPCHASIVPAPTRRSTVAPAYAYGTVIWTVFCSAFPLTDWEMMEPGQRHEIHAGVQGEGRQAADGITILVFIGDQGDRTGRQGSGDRAGITAPLAQRGGRHRGGGDQAVGRGGDGGAQEA